MDDKNRDNPKAWCTRARSRDTGHERGQDVNVGEDKERGKGGKSVEGRQGTREGIQEDKGTKDDDDDKEETTRAESRTETMEDKSQKAGWMPTARQGQQRQRTRQDDDEEGTARTEDREPMDQPKRPGGEAPSRTEAEEPRTEATTRARRRSRGQRSRDQ